MPAHRRPAPTRSTATARRSIGRRPWPSCWLTAGSRQAASTPRPLPPAAAAGSRSNCCREPYRSRAMKPALKIAIAGLGTVGGGVVQLLERQAELLAVRAGRRLVVAAVSARDRRRDRGLN